MISHLRKTQLLVLSVWLCYTTLLHRLNTAMAQSTSYMMLQHLLISVDMIPGERYSRQGNARPAALLPDGCPNKGPAGSAFEPVSGEFAMGHAVTCLSLHRPASAKQF